MDNKKNCKLAQVKSRQVTGYVAVGTWWEVNIGLFNMKRTILTILFFMISMPLLIGCATFPKTMESEQKSNLTYGSVKANIEKGKTTQAEVLQLFGAPNLVTKNRSDDEVWNYNKMSYESLSGSDAGGFIFWGGSKAMTTSNTKSFDLIIIFDSNDVVKDYSIISASF